MLTYLAILFASLLLLSVFGRRAYLFNKKVETTKPEKEEEEKLSEKEVTKREKGRANALCARAGELIEKGKEEEAIKMFVQALALDENHLDTNHKLAMLYLKKQMYGSASALFKRLCSLTNDALHYSHLGLSLYHQSLLEEAKGAYQKSVELDPERAKRFISLAQVYRRLGELQNAIIAVNKALELESKNIDFLYLMADLHLEDKNIDSGSLVLAQVEELDPNGKIVKKMKKAFKALEPKQKD